VAWSNDRKPTKLGIGLQMRFVDHGLSCSTRYKVTAQAENKNFGGKYSQAVTYTAPLWCVTFL
jgi:hypothetical protein